MFRYFLDKNSVWVGVIAGIVIPFVGYAIILFLFDLLKSVGIVNPEGETIIFRPRTIALIALVLNIFPMQYYRRKYFLDSMRGIIFPTILYAILWVIIFGPDLF
jgi:hypothetical protein